MSEFYFENVWELGSQVPDFLHVCLSFYGTVLKDMGQKPMKHVVVYASKHVRFQLLLSHTTIFLF